MAVKILAFAQAAEQLGFHEQWATPLPSESPRSLLSRLYPNFDTASTRVALDCEYAQWDAPIADASELAILPPVSGG
jgi:molybdopterin converting factor small subunit